MTIRITPPEAFFDRRRFLSTLGLGILSMGTGGSAPTFASTRGSRHRVPPAVARKQVTSPEKAAAYGNYFEFLPGRGGAVWKHTGRFEPAPWEVAVEGECERPSTFDLDDLHALGGEERIYHFRCIERWAMNVPWNGFPLRKLLERVGPLPGAKFVTFVSAHLPEVMPGVRAASYLPWPYREGLRIDEAMHDLTFVATGAYGQPLLKQHGAPVRIVVPWKHGFKSPKAVVRIELTREKPMTFWRIRPHECGFLANVNPSIPHPRWEQKTSYWLDTGEAFEPPLFNGYAGEVAGLYPDEPLTPMEPLRPGDVAR